MDFGGFICAGIGAILLAGGAGVVARMFYKKSPNRFRVLTAVLACGVLEALFAGYIYKVYFLDEPLFIAAAEGDAAKVGALLSQGADPEARWEDGTTAIEAASKEGHTQIVAMLRHAGAKQ